MNNLFFHPKKKIYFYVVKEDIFCCECKNIIEKSIFLQRSWSRKRKPIFNEYCVGCIDKIKAKGQADEFKVAYITNIRPTNTIPVFETPPILSEGKIGSVFGCAVDDKQIKADTSTTVTIDRTKLANRESFQGVLIGSPGVHKELEQGLEVKQIQIENLKLLVSKRSGDLICKERQELERKIKETKARLGVIGVISPESENLSLKGADKLLNTLKNSTPLLPKQLERQKESKDLQQKEADIKAITGSTAKEPIFPTQ